MAKEICRTFGGLRTLLSIFVLLGWFLCQSSVVRGQAVDYLQNVGIPAFSALSPVENGYINPANGSLHLEIPLGSFPQRGGGQVKIAFAYDSGIWSQTGGSWVPWGNTPYTGSSG